MHRHSKVYHLLLSWAVAWFLSDLSAEGGREKKLKCCSMEPNFLHENMVKAGDVLHIEEGKVWTLRVIREATTLGRKSFASFFFQKNSIASYDLQNQEDTICKYLDHGAPTSITREIDIVKVAAWYKLSLW